GQATRPWTEEGTHQRRRSFRQEDIRQGGQKLRGATRRDRQAVWRPAIGRTGATTRRIPQRLHPASARIATTPRPRGRTRAKQDAQRRLGHRISYYAFFLGNYDFRAPGSELDGGFCSSHCCQNCSIKSRARSVPRSTFGGSRPHVGPLVTPSQVLPV